MLPGEVLLALPAGVVLDSGIVCAVVRVLPADADDVLERGLHRFGIGIGQHVGAVFHRAAGAAFVAAGVDGVLHRPGIDGAGILQVLAVGVEVVLLAERRPVGQAVVGKHGCTGLRLVKVLPATWVVVDAAAHGGYQGHARHDGAQLLRPWRPGPCC